MWRQTREGQEGVAEVAASNKINVTGGDVAHSHCAAETMRLAVCTSPAELGNAASDSRQEHMRGGP